MKKFNQYLNEMNATMLDTMSKAHQQDVAQIQQALQKANGKQINQIMQILGIQSQYQNYTPTPQTSQASMAGPISGKNSQYFRQDYTGGVSG